jgi:pimeloyl-ACP methyl ester carboxylesterase
MNESQVTARVLAEGEPGGPLAVFAHGIEDSWASWLPVAGQLASRWRLVALDLPWRAGNDYRWRARPASRWLADGIDLAGDIPDVLVAHSFGAGATLEMLCGTASHPARAAVLVCPLFRLPGHPVSWKIFDRSRAKFDQNIRDSVRARMGRRAATLAPGVLETMADLALERVGPTGFVTVFEQFATSGDLPLDGMTLPTLVLAGGADATLSPEVASILAGTLPRGRVQVDDEYDHFCHVTYAGGVAARIADFVDATLTTIRIAERSL